MIHTFYGFSQTPFGKDIPAQELLSTAAFAELSRRLDYMRTRLGLMLVLGEAGTGKTAAVRAFVEQLNASVYKLFYVPLSTVTPLDFWSSSTMSSAASPPAVSPLCFETCRRPFATTWKTPRKLPCWCWMRANACPTKPWTKYLCF